MATHNMGLAKYTFFSAMAAVGVVYHAFSTREQFYPATVYLSTSKIAVAVLGNLCFAAALCLYKLVIQVFLGNLRDLEVEMIRERLSSTVMESLLALTIFREEFSSLFVAMFGTIIFIKVLHWLVQDRVDYVEVTPNVSILHHARLVALMINLLCVDIFFLQHTIHGTIESSGQSVMLLFAFEFIILASNIIRFSLKYVMSMIDVHLEGRWESKGTYVFYLELVTDLLHLFVYCVFFLLVFTNYGLPLHLVRELYSTFRNFRNRIVDFLRFRQVTARLDRFPDATADDLQRSDGVCIICREEMTASGSNKKLFCGHVFHLHCLRSWLERQQNCPTCRGSVFRRPDPVVPDVAPAADAAAAAAAAAFPQDAAAPAAPGAVAPQMPPGDQRHLLHNFQQHLHRVRLLHHRIPVMGAQPQGPAAAVPTPGPAAPSQQMPAAAAASSATSAAAQAQFGAGNYPLPQLDPLLSGASAGFAAPSMTNTYPSHHMMMPNLAMQQGVMMPMMMMMPTMMMPTGFPAMPSPGAFNFGGGQTQGPPNSLEHQIAALAAASATMAAAAAMHPPQPFPGFMFMPYSPWFMPGFPPSMSFGGAPAGASPETPSSENATASSQGASQQPATPEDGSAEDSIKSCSADAAAGAVNPGAVNPGATVVEQSLGCVPTLSGQAAAASGQLLEGLQAEAAVESLHLPAAQDEVVSGSTGSSTLQQSGGITSAPSLLSLSAVGPSKEPEGNNNLGFGGEPEVTSQPMAPKPREEEEGEQAELRRRRLQKFAMQE
ncbi:hypothetical protein CEUSTIGMA_g1287.t1 [Chlamydomonas eustigma]|uniref:RING-type E3 ubiquitin transferase n=1 Tax=Chlamydomonas eustigma TaxID=1157962 RepID=A0A250WSL9_9CHLO|nr:hypothetical protein CEUSTIGMA_g1287.t1 [Chlamydomonas eustigma]|eukprot:GAX73837.1 hypothetical protein CEUSTIGMA_g1287.t1 [Chlamydomonas eustigma]